MYTRCRAIWEKSRFRQNGNGLGLVHRKDTKNGTTLHVQLHSYKGILCK